MHWLTAAAYRALTGRQTPERAPVGPSLMSMLWEELLLGLRSAANPRKLAAAVIAGLGVALLLGPTTPGPVVADASLVVVSTIGGLVALTVAHRALRDVSGDERLRGAATVIAAAAVVVVITLVIGALLVAVTTIPGGPEASPALRIDIDPLLLRASVLLAVAILAARVGDRFAWPTSLLVVGVGMLLGDDGLDLISLDDPELVQSLGIVALVIVLFDGGLGTTPADLTRGLAPGMALATVGVAITTGVSGLALAWLTGMDLLLALLIAAIVSSTDASAVLGVLRQVPVPRRLASTLTLESGANDPVAVLLTIGLITNLQSSAPPGGWFAFGALQVIGGLCLGVACGWATSFLLRHGAGPDSALRPLLALACAGLTYGVTAWVGGSGFLAVYVAGVVVSADPRLDRTALGPFVDAFARSAEIGLFLLLGLLVFPSDLGSALVPAGVLVVCLLLVARPLAVAASAAPFDLGLRESAAISWLGMRGAVPVVLATFAFSAGLPDAPLIFNIVFVVVVVSTLVQGLTVGTVLERLGLAGGDDPEGAGPSGDAGGAALSSRGSAPAGR